MAILSDSTFIVTQADGNRAVYSLQPQHLNDIPGTTLAERVLKHGRALAVEIDGRWHKQFRRLDTAPDSLNHWTPTPCTEEITDPRTIALIERCPEA